MLTLLYMVYVPLYIFMTNNFVTCNYVNKTSIYVEYEIYLLSLNMFNTKTTI